MASILIVAAVPASFVGAWLTWSVGVALLVVAALAIAIAVALTASTVDEIPATVTRADAEPITGTAPDVRSVKVVNPFAAPPRRARAR